MIFPKNNNFDKFQFDQKLFKFLLITFEETFFFSLKSLEQFFTEKTNYHCNAATRYGFKLVFVFITLFLYRALE